MTKIFILLLAISLHAETGLAAWYKVSGKLTYSGIIQKKGALVAAHKSLPMGTKVHIKNNDNQKEVVVIIVDRLPKNSKFMIDLSKDAAKVIDIITSGIAKVTLTKVP